MSEFVFDPEAAERQARETNPAYAEARQRQEAEKEKYLEPVIEYFSRLEEEVANMPIAQRFRRDRTPDFTAALQTYHPMLHGLSEAEFKRAQLMSDLQSAKSDAMMVISKIETIVMDIEATKRD